MDPAPAQDLMARLTFTVQAAAGETRRFVQLMAYKHYGGRGGLAAKVLMFTLFPPDRRDISFLGWLYDPGAGRRADDMWLYLPQLRAIRKLGHRHEPHHKAKDSEDEFSLSELQRFELQPRPAAPDRHQDLGRDRLNGVPVIKILSTPREPDSTPYAAMRRWLDAGNHLPLRIEYLDGGGRTVKRVDFDWQQARGHWLWREVTAVNLRTGARTRLQQEIIKVDGGLPDKLFTKRYMRRGAAALERFR